MTALLRVGLACVLCSFSIACSDGADGGGDPMGMSGSSGNGGTATSGGSSTAGSSTIAGSSSGGSGGSGGSTATGGGGTSSGGTSGGSATAGSGGSGGVAIDPNGGAPSGPASGRHKAVPIGTYPEATSGYYEYLPPHYGNGARYPLLVFRHGIGENGNGVSELDKVLVNGPPKLIKANQWPEDRKFVVLSVQHTGDGCASVKETEDFLAFAMEKYDVDPKRIYLTGLSCGAIGSWDYLGTHTNEIIAAAVLVCGNGRPAFAKAGCSLGNVPIWAFHGLDDKTVVPEGSTETVASLKACTDPAPADVKLTTYPGVGHDSWTMTYNLSNPENDIYAWMMSHTK
jgi:predicted esterase